MTIGDIILKYWAVILFLCGLVYHALWVYGKVGEHERRLKKLEEERDTMLTITNRINERLSAIDAKLELLVKGYKHE